MFGVGTSELLVIFLVALLVIGPSKLPEIAKTLGRALAEFRRVSSDVQRQLDLEVQLAEMEKNKERKEQEEKKIDDISSEDKSPENSDKSL